MSSGDQQPAEDGPVQLRPELGTAELRAARLKRFSLSMEGELAMGRAPINTGEELQLCNYCFFHFVSQLYRCRTGREWG